MQVRTGARRAAGPLVLAVAVAALAALAPAAQAGQRTGGHARHTSAVSLTRIAGWSAGPVQRWTGYRRPGGSRRVREVQRRLDRLGYRAGPVDGLFGPRTERATRRFQRHRSMRVDGVVGRHTLHALRRAAHRRHQPVTTPRPTAPPPQRTTAPTARPGSPPVADTVREAPARPEPPVTLVLIGIGVLGAAAGTASFVHTRKRIRDAQRAALQARPDSGPSPPRRTVSMRGGGR
jgi:hypothetical protein